MAPGIPANSPLQPHAAPVSVPCCLFCSPAPLPARPPPCSAIAKVLGPKLAPTVVTRSFITFWYGLNVAFNLQVGAAPPACVASARYAPGARCAV